MKSAEKDLYVRSREAEADLLAKLAEAESTRMRNTVMQSPGADRYVAMQMADVLNGLEFILLPTGADSNLIPLDLNRMLGLLGVTPGSVSTPEASVANPRIEELMRDAEANAEAARQEIENPAPSLMETIVTEGEVTQ